MKKIYSLLVTALVCLLGTTVWAETVSKDEALQLAGVLFAEQAQSDAIAAPARKAPSKTINGTQLSLKKVAKPDSLRFQKNAVSKITANTVTRTGVALSRSTDLQEMSVKAIDIPQSLNYDQFYIIQEDDEDGGWVMMAADDAVEPILAYSPTGTFKFDNMPANLRGWLDGYNEQIKYVVKNGLKANTEVVEEWTSLRSGVRRAKAATNIVGPLVQTKWDQDAPYYNNCPSNSTDGHAVVGCVATAMAQVMKYWEWPNEGQGSKSYTDAKGYNDKGVQVSNSFGTISANFATAYDWSNMPTYCTNSSSTTQKNAVALLSFHCGVSVEMDYDNSANGGSGAYTLNNGSDTRACAQNALWRYFKYDYSTLKSYSRSGGSGYSSWTESNWIAMLKAELDQNRPIIYSGRGTGGGHCFICDGYDSDNKFHFNWGWSGSNDGFYSINNLVPGSGGSGGGSYSFSDNQGCIIGIQPVVDDKFTVTYNAGSHATCATTTQKQASIGQSVTLPNVSSVADHYLFLGWSDVEGSQIPNIGKAGDSYTPMRNITLYAVVVQDGYVVRFKSSIAEGDVAAVIDGEELTWTSVPVWSGHGSCEVDSLREEGTGSGIILPSASNNAGWTFQEWVAISSSGGLYSAGMPGDKFYPSSNENVYAYWTDDSKVWLDYLLMGVTKTGGPDEGWIAYADGLTATFVAADDFFALTNANTTVTVEVDGEAVANCYSIANNVLTITLTPAQLSGDVDIAIRATQDYTACPAYTYTYTASQGTGNKTLGNYTWNISKTGTGAANTYNATLGQIFGTAGARRATPLSPGTVTYTSSTPAACHINTITVAAAGTITLSEADLNAMGEDDGIEPGAIEAFIGGVSLGKQYLNNINDYTQQTYNNKTYFHFSAAGLSEISWQNASNLTGELKFVLTPGTGSGSLLYVKSINVSISESVLGGPYHVPVTGMDAYYLPDGDAYVWYTQLYGDGDYPYVVTLFDAADETSLNGTHSTYYLEYEANANSIIEAFGRPKITLAYKEASGDYYSIYHVTANWTDDEGREYYIDDDVTTMMLNYECYLEKRAEILAEDPNAGIYLEDIADCIDHPTSDASNTKITYTVNHRLQNVTGNGYTLEESNTFATKSGNTITAARNVYTGFLTPDAKSITVSNTNKTVDYYYDRITYPVSFVVNNIAVQRDTVRYKATPVYTGSTPMRTATEDFEFEFAGWSPQLGPVKQATTYTAQFSTIAIVTVTFDANEHGTAPAKQVMSAGDKATNPGNLTAAGYTFGGWYTEPACVNQWNFNNVVNSSITLYAKWTPNTHSLTWNANGGTLSGTYTSGNAVAYGTAITQPTASRTGYTFAGWDNVVPATMPDNDLSFTAQWTPNTNTAYKVQHFQQNIADDNFSLFETENLTGTTATNVTPARKSYTGFTAPASQTAAIAADGSLVINYNYTRNKYALTWNADGGNIAGSNYTKGDVKYGASITAPANANVTKAGYDFQGWSPAVPATMPAEALTLTAQWSIKTYAISFSSEDENKGTVSVSGEKALYNYGDEVTITASPKAGYSFSKWSDNNTSASRTVRIGIDVTSSLTASFSANTNTPYTVRFWKQNISDDEYTEQLPAENPTGTTGALTNAMAEAKVYQGFERQAFEEVAIAGDGSTVVNIYYNRLTYAIRFLNGESILQNENLRFGDTPSYKGTEPKKDADAQYTYSFKGWSPAIYEVDKAQDYTATFNQIVNRYDISFNANGHGAAPATQNLAYGSKVTKPADLTETGYTFGGWFKEEACVNAWDFATETVNGAQILYAKWTINIHKVSWNANGGTITSTNHTVGDAIEYGTPIVAAVAEREHYNFIRWAPNPPATMPDNDLVFVAQWVAAGDTPYEVHHFKQNLNDEGYTEVLEDKLEMKGATGATVKPVVNEYEGFTSPEQQEAVITNDGELKINYYYTRNSYNLVWNADGGVLVDNGYTRGSVKYEAPVTAPADPTREGYTFLGWDNAKPATMPAKDLTLVAQWQIISYSGIHFDSNNSTMGSITVSPQQDSYDYGEQVTVTANPNEGYEFSGWSDGQDNDQNPRTVTIGSDITSGFNAIFAPKSNVTYTIRHLKEALDGSWVQDGADIVKNDGVTGQNKTVEPNSYTGFRTPSAQTIQIAGDGSTVFEYKYVRLAFNLSWDADGGELSGEYTQGDAIKFETPISAPNIARTGYIFKGWNAVDGEPEAIMPAHALAYKAVWEAEKFNNVSIPAGEQEGGFVTVEPEKNEYSYDEQVTISANAEEGYEFSGWSDGVSEATRTVIISGDTTITAIFTPKSGIKYVVRRFLQNIDDDNFTQLGEDQELTGTTGELVNPEVEEIEGFTAPEVQAVEIAGNGSTVIVLNYTRNSYNLVWDANGGNLLDNGRSEGSIRFGKPIVAAAAEWIGHIFKGWSEEVPATMPAKDLTLAAQWDKEQVTGVTFSVNDENAGSIVISPAKDTYEYGDEVTITATANDGYSFNGWSDGSQDGNPRTIIIDSDTTISAIFVPNTNTKYVIRVFLQNIENDEFTLSNEIERTGTTGQEISPSPEIFEGFTAPEAQIANIAGDGSTAIEYRYIRNKYLLVWDANGGALSGEFTKDSVKFEAPIIAPEALREGYSFLGWDAAIPETMPANDLTFIAQWQEEDQGIEIILDGRTIVGPQGFHIYDFNGRDVTGLNGQLGNGLYIIVSGGSVEKIFIR